MRGPPDEPLNPLRARFGEAIDLIDLALLHAVPESLVPRLVVIPFLQLVQADGDEV